MLIGTARYTALDELPHVANNLEALKKLLCEPDLWGVHEANCRIVADPAHVPDVVEAVAKAAQEAKDTLVVYYAGHGLLDEKLDLHLTLTDSQPGKVDYTAVPYQHVRKRIHESGARRKIVILDCCYSARAEMTGRSAPIIDKATISGTYLLTAAEDAALAVPGETYTAFTGELVSLLRKGLPGGPELLDLDTIYRTLREMLASRSRPLPHSQDRDQGGDLTLVRNRAVTQPDAPEARAEARHRVAAIRDARAVGRRASAAFLRRNKLPNHQLIYVRRALDRDLATVTRAVAPGALERLTRRRTFRHRGEQAVDRDVPPQIVLVLDPPGSGKTMLATQLALADEAFFCVARTADDPGVHELNEVLRDLGGKDPLDLLVETGMPLVYVVDGLDEADNPESRRAIVQLLKTLGKLNAAADRRRLLAFPVLLVFTARDDTWERWISVFEGRSVVRFKDRLARFSDEELGQALTRYSEAYQYSLVGSRTPDGTEALSVPFNLRVLSEAYEFQGPVRFGDALGENVLQQYFERRRSNIAAQGISGLTATVFMELAGDLALAAVRTPEARIPEQTALRLIAERSPRLRGNEREVLGLLIAEQLLRHDGTGALRFRYPAFIEYLVALTAVRSPGLDRLEEVTEKVAAAPEVSSAAVRRNVRSLARSMPPEVARQANTVYTTSPTYVTANLTTFRSDLGRGTVTAAEDLETIHRTIGRMSPADAWEAFFVVVAKPNGQPADRVVYAFGHAWDKNSRRPDRWRLLEKIGERRVLTDDEVVERIAGSRRPREWEVFLAWLSTYPERSAVAHRLRTSRDGDLLAVFREGGLVWDQVTGLFTLALNDQDYVEGVLFGSAAYAPTE
ncbi:caspase, EACC1-associated type [Actinoallomurus sp. CA-142502]|uniref:caspase, EACC1-associated type n=1 Tax=Actinoallomurus sp. CA-142502 TaxID=3239885 RepID=UPI003D8D4DBA